MPTAHHTLVVVVVALTSSAVLLLAQCAPTCTSQSCPLTQVCDASGACVAAPAPVPLVGEGEGEGEAGGGCGSGGGGCGSGGSGLCGASLTSFSPSDTWVIGQLAPGNGGELGIGQVENVHNYAVGWRASSFAYQVSASGDVVYLRGDGNGDFRMFKLVPDTDTSKPNTSGQADTPVNSCSLPSAPEINDVEIATDKCAAGDNIIDFVIDGDNATSYVYDCFTAAGDEEWFSSSGQALTPSDNIVVSLSGDVMLVPDGVQPFGAATSTPVAVFVNGSGRDAIATSGSFRVLFDAVSGGNETLQLLGVSTSGSTTQQGTYDLGTFQVSDFGSVTLTESGDVFAVVGAAGDVVRLSLSGGAPATVLAAATDEIFTGNLKVVSGGGPKHF